MQTAINQIQSLLSSLTVQELRQINSDVVGLVNNKQRIENIKKMSEFRIGSLVEFTSSKTGKPVRIRITKMNSKTVSGQEVSRFDNTDTMGTWRVAPSLLRAA